MRVLLLAILLLAGTAASAQANSSSKPQPDSNAPKVCDLQPSDIPGILMCDRDNGTCTIRLHTLKCLEKKGDAAIEVQKGEQVRWLGDHKKDDSTCTDNQVDQCPQMWFQPFKPHLQDGVCGNPDNANSPFDNDFSKDTPSHTKYANVSQLVSDNSCFKHVIVTEDHDLIDPHIIIGGIGLKHKPHSQKKAGKNP